MAERKQIEVGTELAEGMPLARCDAGLSFQACTNLVSNALKFTPPGGRVVLVTRSREDRVRVEVRDSGPGVPAAERSLLFQEHARLSPRPTAGEESNGLGLSIVRQLIEAQGGGVGAEFPESGGSVFWFELPFR
jgi:signal transduction histidine kinase